MNLYSDVSCNDQSGSTEWDQPSGCTYVEFGSVDSYPGDGWCITAYVNDDCTGDAVCTLPLDLWCYLALISIKLESVLIRQELPA